MKYTENLNLKKPEYDDIVDIPSDFNSNMDIIDEKIKEIESSLDNADLYETYLLSSMLTQEDIQQKRNLIDLETEIGEIALVNTDNFPFNNSIKTIAMKKQRNTLNYRVTTEVLSADGEVGDIIISDKQLNGFKIEYTGSATSVTIKYYVQGGMYQ